MHLASFLARLEPSEGGILGPINGETALSVTHALTTHRFSHL